jgi:hypothetical protein
LIAPVVTLCPCVFTDGAWSTFFPTYIAGISMPAGKIAFSLSSGDVNL